MVRTCYTREWLCIKDIIVKTLSCLIIEPIYNSLRLMCRWPKGIFSLWIKMQNILFKALLLLCHVLLRWIFYGDKFILMRVCGWKRRWPWVLHTSTFFSLQRVCEHQKGLFDSSPPITPSTRRPDRNLLFCVYGHNLQARRERSRSSIARARLDFDSPSISFWGW